MMNHFNDVCDSRHPIAALVEADTRQLPSCRTALIEEAAPMAKAGLSICICK